MKERRMVEDAYKKIEAELKKQKISKKIVAQKLGYKSTSGLTNAIKRGSLRLSDFVTITEMLNMHPIDFFMGNNRIDIYKMSLYDAIKIICRQEIEDLAEEGGA